MILWLILDGDCLMNMKDKIHFRTIWMNLLKNREVKLIKLKKKTVKHLDKHWKEIMLGITQDGTKLDQDTNKI